MGKSSMTINKINLIIFALLLFIMTGFAEFRVTRGNFEKRLVISGSLQAQKAERLVVPRSNSWQVQIKWMVEEGVVVKPGDPVVRFDTANLSSEIENLEISLQTKIESKTIKEAERKHKRFDMNNLVKRGELEYQKAKIDAEIPKGIFSDYDYEQKQLELRRKAEALKKAKLDRVIGIDTLEGAIKKLSLEIQEEKEKLKVLQDLLSGFTLKAKTGGAVLYGEHPWQGRKIQVDDNVPSNTTVATIPNKESLQVEAWVNETEINRIKPGQKVEMMLDAYPDYSFKGIIRDVSNRAKTRDEWGKAHYFAAIIEPSSRDLNIMKPGMSVQCTVNVAQQENVMLIPLDAAYFDGVNFWIKPLGQKARKVNHLGFNAFSLAVVESGELTEGMALAAVQAGDIEEGN